HTRFSRDWSSDVCSSDLATPALLSLPIVWAVVTSAYRGRWQLPKDSAVKDVAEETIPLDLLETAKTAVVAIAVIGALIFSDLPRSEERRVGKESRSWCTR